MNKVLAMLILTDKDLSTSESPSGEAFNILTDPRYFGSGGLSGPRFQQFATDYCINKKKVWESGAVLRYWSRLGGFVQRRVSSLRKAIGYCRAFVGRSTLVFVHPVRNRATSVIGQVGVTTLGPASLVVQD